MNKFFAPKKTVITCHRNADFDAVCSLFALSFLYPSAEILYPGSQEKVVQNFVDDVISPLFNFISPKEFVPENIERLVIVDTSHTSRLTHLNTLFSQIGLDISRDFLQQAENIEIVIFDHHPQSNLIADYGSSAIVGSTCTLICEEYQKQNREVPCEILHLLGLGLYADTGAFTYNSTTTRDTQVLTYLIEHGFNADFVSPYVGRQINREQLFILNDLVENAKFYDIAGVKFALAYANVEDFLFDIASLAPMFLEVHPCDVLFMVTAMDSKIQVVARSKDSAVDVGKIMALLGGGGHAFAAAATIKDKTLLEVVSFLENQISLFSHTDKTVRRLMSSPVVAMEDCDSVSLSADTMMHYGFKAIPIVEKGTKICVGIIEYQTTAKAIKHGFSERPVSEFMNKNIRVATIDTNLQILMDIIVEDRQRLVPIVANQTLSAEKECSEEELALLPMIGVVTRTDLVRVFLDEQSSSLTKKQHRLSKRNVERLLRVHAPKQCIKLLEIAGELAEEVGVSLYVVGGFVRDLILDRGKWRWPHMDIDLVVEGDGILFAHYLATRLGGRVREHKEFMTAIVLFPSHNIDEAEKLLSFDDIELRVDVATARLEYYQSPAVLPTVELSSIRMDLNRRDFTINAMAIKLNTPHFGELQDFFDGQGDIKQKRIRMLHALSFIDDPTRAMRAIRFEQRYDFKICVQCERLIRNALALQVMKKLEGKRILGELEIILEEETVLDCIIRMQDFGILKEIHPCLELEREDEIAFVAEGYKVLEWYKMLYLSEKVDLLAFFILIMTKGVIAEDIKDLLQRLQCTESQLQSIMQKRSSLMQVMPQVEKWFETKESMSKLHILLADISIEAILYCIVRLEEKKGEEIKKLLSYYIYQVRYEKIEITGADILALGVKQGPKIGEILKQVLYAKIDKHIEGYDDEIALAKTLIE